MDARRRLSRLAAACAALFLLGGCALLRPPDPGPLAGPGAFAAEAAAPAPASAVDRAETAPALPDGFRPYLAPDPVVGAAPGDRAGGRDGPAGPVAIAAANRRARAESRADAFVGGVQVFAYAPGRVYEVWTAPLRVTLLTLAPGETLTAKAAGDTVRWRIGESVSGAGAATRAHVLIKPLSEGLETNLVLTTNQRVYLLALRSGSVERFNAAVAWDDGRRAPDPDAIGDRPGAPDAAPALDLAPVTPQGPLDARYGVEPQGRSPRWTPTAVFNDGVRTFLVLPPAARVDETPALFVVAGGRRQLVNYRQSGGLLIVDRLFDQAELRLGDRRPQVVRIRRLEGAVR